MLYSYANRPTLQLEPGGGKSKTERFGYLTPRQQIEQMMAAGKRLMEFRKGAYDFDEESLVDETLSDPTRDPGYDLADASMASLAADRAIKEMRARKSAEPVVESIGEAPGASGEESIKE